MRFEKIWIEQCRATRAIKRRFGVKDALDYLVGEKLRMFAGAARHRGSHAGAIFDTATDAGTARCNPEALLSPDRSRGA